MIDTGEATASGETGYPTSSIGRKRKQINDYEPNDGSVHSGFDEPNKKAKTGAKGAIANDSDSYEISQTKTAPGKKRSTKGDGDGKSKGKPEEKRLRRYRKNAPLGYLVIKDRALSQRLTVLGRERCGTDELPKEKVTIAGSTGNIYTVDIGLVPDCDCPHSKAGNQCKHVIYVMLRVLKAPEEIGYQLALTSSELRSVMQNAPGIPSADAEAESSDGGRKPIEGECPICYADFEDTDEIVYCKAACGNNVHKECMASWTAARQGKATCPLCRTSWADQSFVSGGKVDMDNAIWSGAYRNVASQLGLSGERDFSSYHQPWVQAKARRGWARYRR